MRALDTLGSVAILGLSAAMLWSCESGAGADSGMDAPAPEAGLPQDGSSPVIDSSPRPDVAPLCNDGIHNGDETDVDCGGSCPKPCVAGKGCALPTDCFSLVCRTDLHCAAPSCTDGVKNGSESDLDCGAVCPVPCATGLACGKAQDCLSGVCSPGATCDAPSCTDGVHNGDETDVDCGVACATPCAAGKGCAQAADCVSGVCGPGGYCADPSCFDGVKNGGEGDIDCGEVCVKRCGLGQTCNHCGDCAVSAPFAAVVCDGVCRGPHSCQEMVQSKCQAKALTNAVYALRFPNAQGTHQAYCDTTTDGGGWTLVMAAIDTNFAYDDPLWENTAVLNPTSFSFTSGTKSKYPSFSVVPLTELRTSYPTNFSAPGRYYSHKLLQPVASARALFAGPGLSLGNSLNYYFNEITQPFNKQCMVPPCNCTQYVALGINQKALLGTANLGGGVSCDGNGGARFGQRVNGYQDGAGNHVGQGWGAYSIQPTAAVHFEIHQLLWVR